MQVPASPIGLVVKMSKHAVQGSNLPPPDLESGIPPLKNFRRIFIFAPTRDNAQGGTRTPVGHGPAALQAAAIAALPPTRFQVSVEGFEPSTPCARGTCAAKLRYTLMIFDQHSRRDSNSRSPTENRKSCRLDDGSKFVHQKQCSRRELNPHPLAENQVA